MALIAKDGAKISFESTELINELKRDITECGKEQVFAVFLKYYPKYGVEVVTNYDFIVEEMPISKSDLRDGERIALMQASVLLEMLEKQNSII